VGFCPIDVNLNVARGEVCTREAGIGVDACDDLDFMIPETRWHTVSQTERKKSTGCGVRPRGYANGKIKYGTPLGGKILGVTYLATKSLNRVGGE
jgi:hypothetical protein